MNLLTEVSKRKNKIHHCPDASISNKPSVFILEKIKIQIQF